MKRRRLLEAGLGAMLGAGPKAAMGGEEAAPEPLRIADLAVPGAGSLQPAEFGIVGVFDVDWLLQPRFTRLLDHLAASPGAFKAVRFFGALNSGELEDKFPKRSGGVWRRIEDPPDFTTTLRALDALVSRGLVPFIALTFFPSAVSASPIAPPANFEAWGLLVRNFLDAVVARFGAIEVARWWFEAWNEPNMPPFWGGSFDQFLALYRATSNAVVESGHAVRLGGPALAYVPTEGPALMERFLRFIQREPALRCEFISYHRKGIWVTGEDEPLLARLGDAAAEVADLVLRLVPERARGLYIVNDEADMKVGFDDPFEPRLTEQFPAWLAASLILHEDLSDRYAPHGMRFLAEADDANQQLVRAPFDGRRSLMTPTSANAPEDLLKLPVFAFYELLPLLGDRRCVSRTGSDPVTTELRRLATVANTQIGVLFTSFPDQRRGPGWRVEYTLEAIPWPRINVAWFRIDHTHANAFTASGEQMPAVLQGPEVLRRIRSAQELGVAAPIRSGLVLNDGVFRDDLELAPFATALLWITPFSSEPPAPPQWLSGEASSGNAVLRWTPSRQTGFYTYEVFRMPPDRPGVRVSPVPLRSAMWVDTAPPPGAHVYGVRTVTASGVASALVSGPRIRI